VSSFVQVDFTVLVYMVAGVFGLVGFFRGWWKEAITAGLLSALVFLLKRPEAASGVIDSLNLIVTLLWKNILLPLASAGEQVSAQADSGPILGEDSYSSYVIVLIVFILLSYFVSKIGLTERVSAGGRILGAIFGFYNGFVVITLVRDLLVGGLFPGTADMMATSMQPEELSIQLTNMPTTSIISGSTAMIFIIVGVILFFVAIGSSYKTENRKLMRRPPPLYGGKPKKKTDRKQEG
jgi:hypothetical protein